ncbi:hypothetical protein AA103196_0208 [Ameyamaea chiangmaiensis NBRC 103196]|uniref:Uncharacterized protein n=1 Tax=Ameyamaea chiangmaiensis TaxID=442969 RepID=A0A850P5V5_9PROT|nr:hypothetical protein [Ameyamaea chiangmaiensis]MBS4076538.1 hypothetical protein [Ameyamaea chiangmaiensis]NVN40007.1 hypothetical protein [Ameyamaea chiangmaiensis]GBQ62060.1 hypothetical protein AA103196_0208 [Ameyamaea chiangmaiensis NBRC 103196]
MTFIRRPLEVWQLICAITAAERGSIRRAAGDRPIRSMRTTEARAVMNRAIDTGRERLAQQFLASEDLTHLTRLRATGLTRPGEASGR